MKIICDNEYCIYEENGECMLDEIEINGFGNCMECTYPSIPKGYL